MNENDYYGCEFTDAELNCHADTADYRRAVEEFFLEHQYQMDERTRAAFRRYLEEPVIGGAQHRKMTTALLGFPLNLGELQWQEGVAAIRERLRPNLRSHA